MIRGVGQLTQDDPEVQAEQPGIEELQLVQVNPSKYVPSGHCAKQKILTIVSYVLESESKISVTVCVFYRKTKAICLLR